MKKQSEKDGEKLKQQLTRRGSSILNIKVSKQLSTLVVNNDVWNGYLQYGVKSIQGVRPEQEDSHLAVKKSEKPKEINDIEESPFSYFAVFDGHGGQKAAQYSSENVYRLFLEKSKSTRKFQQVLKDSLLQVEDEILKKAEDDDSLTDGTTACIAVLKSHTMIVGNIGDTEMVLSRENRPVVLTEVHNPGKNNKERERVLKDGGILTDHKRLKHPRFPMCTIAVSRSLGDSFFKLDSYLEGKPCGLISEPFIIEVSLTSKDEFAVIACDGVWDVLNYDEVVSFVHQELSNHNDPQKAADNLVQKALSSGSKDNITSVVIAFKSFK